MDAEQSLKNLPGSEKYIIPLRKFARIIKVRRLDKKLDCTIAVTGDKGFGKSTLSYWAAGFIEGDRFDIERNFIFDPHFKVIKERIWGLPNKSAPIIDEGIKSLYRQNWFTEVQKSLFQMMNTTRVKQQALFVCIPDFHDLRSSFTKTIVDYWIHIPVRGFAIVMEKSPNEFQSDRWNIKENCKIFEENTKRISYSDLGGDVNKLLSIHEKIRNYIGYVFFPTMPPKEEELYKSISDPIKKSMWDSSEEEAETTRMKKLRHSLMKAIYVLNTRQARMSQAEICRELDLKDASVSQWMQIIRNELEKQKQAAPQAVPAEIEKPKEVDVNESPEGVIPDKREGAVG